MKTFITIQLLVVASICYSQQYDTIFHTGSKPARFQFLLSDTTLTRYKVSKVNLKTLEGDTTRHTIETDTFFVRRLGSELDESYDYWLSKQTWINTILGSKCAQFHHKISHIPKFILEWSDVSESFKIKNCKENIPIIEATLAVYIDCIENSEDQYMLKYVLEDIENLKDCNKQTHMMMQDLGHVVSYLNLPIPDQDSIIRFSILDKNDTTGLLNVHFRCEKLVDTNGTTIKFSEDQSQSEPASSKMHSALYDAFKDMLSPEEQKRDSIRFSSKEDYELTTITVDKDMIFQEYRRHRHSAMLNIDLKMEKSEFFHIIERIKD